MRLSEELKWRGFLNQTTIKKLTDLDEEKWVFYHGYDASVDSLTVGNLAAIMLDRCFIRHGHKAILLAGGATSLIGDPGGKDKERTLQTEQTVRHNVLSVQKQLESLIGPKAHFVNNLDWLGKMPVLDFLRDVGKHFSMTPLVQRDYIARRIGEGGAGISFTEFSYTLLQGYDFLHLYQKYGVELQLAGSDQWGNCLSGVELVRRVTGKEVHALTMPLILNKITGKKFGKSEEGAVWLDSKLTSPEDFYQFWINVGDDHVGDYLKIFTELDKDKIAAVMTSFEKDKPARLAQKTLAYEVTKLVHGEKEADQAKENAEQLSATRSPSASISPSMSASPSPPPGIDVKPAASVIDVLVQTGLVVSRSEARQLLKSGGIYINDNQTDKEKLDESDFIDGIAKLRRGKTLQNTRILKKK